MEAYIKRYNKFLIKYKEVSGIELERFELMPYDYSSSGKTIREFQFKINERLGYVNIRI